MLVLLVHNAFCCGSFLPVNFFGHIACHFPRWEIRSCKYVEPVIQDYQIIIMNEGQFSSLLISSFSFLNWLQPASPRSPSTGRSCTFCKKYNNFNRLFLRSFESEAIPESYLVWLQWADLNDSKVLPPDVHLPPLWLPWVPFNFSLDKVYRQSPL